MQHSSDTDGVSDDTKVNAETTPSETIEAHANGTARASVYSIFGPVDATATLSVGAVMPTIYLGPNAIGNIWNGPIDCLKMRKIKKI